jgi:hypothetical protein
MTLEDLVRFVSTRYVCEDIPMDLSQFQVRVSIEGMWTPIVGLDMDYDNCVLTLEVE